MRWPAPTAAEIVISRHVLPRVFGVPESFGAPLPSGAETRLQPRVIEDVSDRLAIGRPALLILMFEK